MKKVIVFLMAMMMIFTFSACGGGSSDEKKSDEKQTETVKRDLPKGDYKDVGDGTFYLTGPSGSTENGDKIVIYPDENSTPHAFVGIELWDLDGSVQTYIYVDGVEMDKQQGGAGYQGSIDFDDNSLWAITEGEHEVEAVQYADNDTSKDMTFYIAVKYTVNSE